MKAAFLPDRGVVKVAGADARTFLNGLLTSDVTQATPAAAKFAALLTPQGKIVVDCIVAEAPAEDDDHHQAARGSISAIESWRRHS